MTVIDVYYCHLISTCLLLSFDIYVSITVIWYLRVHYSHLISTCPLLSFDIYVSITVIWYLRVYYCHLISTCILLSLDIYVSITVIWYLRVYYCQFTHIRKLLVWRIFHYEERSGPIKVNLSQPFSLKCQEQARKVSCHVHVCKCYPFFLKISSDSNIHVDIKWQ
jgi:hypothetical protein